MRILHGAAMTVGFVLLFPMVPALASHGQKDRTLADLAEHGQSVQAVEAGQAKQRVTAPLRLTQLQRLMQLLRLM